MSSRTDEPGRFSLPPGATTYRTIGPFDGDSLPKGLLREHRLKELTWGRLRVLSDEIRFVWDDGGGTPDSFIARANTIVVIPPTVPHHLELLGPNVLVEIDFMEVSA